MLRARILARERSALSTESISPRYVDIDSWPSAEAVEAMLESQLAAVAALRPAIGAIARAADAAAARLAAEGRLIYVGAGTSGRLGVQDGVELVPTFDWDPERLAWVMAGGDTALLRSVENAEDDADDARLRLAALALTRNDVVIGVAASGATPFTVAAIAAARAAGALTIGIANSPGAPLLEAAEIGVLADTGAEVVAGSTRMKAGTAQKVALNLVSTMTMIRLGRVYRGMMVQMRPTNAKLRRRGVRMVQRIVGCDEATAQRAFDRAGGDVKVALLVANDVSPGRARTILDRAGGNIRDALADVAWGAEPEDDGC